MNKENMTGAEWFQDFGDRLNKNGSLEIDQAKLELSEQVFQLMQEQGVTEAELARRLGSSRAYVNKVLQGSTNFTIESLVKLGLALNRELKLGFVENKSLAAAETDSEITIIYEDPIDLPVIVLSAESNVKYFAEYTSTQQINQFEEIDTEETNAAVEIAA